MATISTSVICNRCGSSGDNITKPFIDTGLHARTERYLRKTSYDSLCPVCVAELNSMVIQSSHEQFPATGPDMQQDKHYYMDGDYMVFTEYYHIARGFCCQSGCRHCAYGNNHSGTTN